MRGPCAVLAGVGLPEPAAVRGNTRTKRRVVLTAAGGQLSRALPQRINALLQPRITTTGNVGKQRKYGVALLIMLLRQRTFFLFFFNPPANEQKKSLRPPHWRTRSRYQA